MIRYPVLALLGLLAIAPGLAVAQNLDKGFEAAQRGDYATALAELRPLAEQGHAGAQYSLAKLYHDGRGVLRDDEQAANWYRRAAEGGMWFAAFDLGMLYWDQSLANATDAGPPDEALVRVHMWLGIAAAREIVGCVELSAPVRDAVAQSMTSEQVARAEELTRAWLAEHVMTDANVASAKPGC
jgi:TPR repeat protein